MRNFQIGDLVKVKPGNVPVSNWMREAQAKGLPLLIVGVRRQEGISELPEDYRNQYQVIYNGECMWIYKKVLEEIAYASYE